VPITIPKCLANGDYLLRPEHIALHSVSTVRGARCAALQKCSSGTARSHRGWVIVTNIAVKSRAFQRHPITIPSSPTPQIGRHVVLSALPTANLGMGQLPLTPLGAKTLGTARKMHSPPRGSGWSMKSFGTAPALVASCAAKHLSPHKYYTS
jgi:hypothetical protein